MRSTKPLNLFIIATIAFAIFSCQKPANQQSQDSTGEAENTEVADEGNAEEEANPEENPDGITPIAEWATAESLVMNCGGAVDLAEPIGVIAANITDDSLMYDVEPYSDCSGTFHRVLDSLKVRCADFSYPDKDNRDSRALGRWYHEQGNFVRVINPLDMSNYIKPGAVMFYGPRQGDVDSLAVESLFAQGGINHVGVIVSVEKDEEGIVTGYSLFHGQRPGKYASTTNYHKREYRNRPEYPPYGNGSEQWVGVAPIISE